MFCPSISNFRPYESSHMERSTDLKGRHMLLSTTIRDTLMFTSYSSCPSLASALLGLYSHGSKGKKCLSKTKTGMFSSGKRTTPTTMWCIEISWTRAQLQDWIEVLVPTLSGRTMCCRQGKSQKMRISEARASQWQEEGVATLSDHRQRYLGSPALCCLYLWACPWLP